MNVFSNQATTSTAVVSIDSIKSFMEDFERKFPAAQRCIRIRASAGVVGQLRAACAPSIHEPLNAIGRGLPIETDDTLPYPAWVEEMANGEEVVHLAGMEFRRQRKPQL